MENIKKSSIWPLIVAVLFVAAAWSANCYFLIENDERGTFGDMFGAVNSVFSGLAFAGVIYAILLQRDEVVIAKEEIAETKKILAAQNDLTELQQKSQAKQMFENTFFQTLDLFARLTSEMDIKGSVGAKKLGKEIFGHYLQGMINDLKNGKSAHECYDSFYNSHAPELGHYFRVLYNLVKLVDRSGVENKRFYTNLIRANLSDDEALILYLNGLSDLGKKHFKALMEEYALLKNVDRTHVLYQNSNDTYDSRAF